MSETGLRYAKKLATFRAIAHAARELVLDKGLDQVTVEEIADAAGVSPRTFFNYFPCKEDAVVGVEPGLLAELAHELLERPPAEGPVTALRAVLVGDDIETVVRRFRIRDELVNRCPALLPRHLAAASQVEQALTQALARRLGIDPATDPSPKILVTTVVAALRAAFTWWHESGHAEPLPLVLDRALTFIDPAWIAHP